MPKILKNITLNTNRDRLIDEIKAQYPNMVYRFAEHSPTEPYLEIDDTSADSGVLDTIIAAHNPAVLTTAQMETTQADATRATLKNLMTGLHTLSAHDKGYAVYGRLMAWGDGADNAVINAIIDRTTATAYITAKPEWAGATAATRAILADVLEANARLTMALLLILTD